MKSERTLPFTRRKLLHTLPPAMVCAMVGGCRAKQPASQDRRGFWSEYTPEEQAAIDASAMAQDMTNFVGHGYGCAECSYMVGLRYLGEPEQRLGAALAFSGGFGKGELCGFFSGGMMTIGVAARKLHEDRKAMREFAKPRIQALWDWWTERGPLHCSDLNELYEGDDAFLRMGQRTAAKVEELIAPARPSGGAS